MSVFDQGVAAKVSDSMEIVRVSDYDEERGYLWFIRNTNNGNQWACTMPFTLDEAHALRDALCDLLDGHVTVDTIAWQRYREVVKYAAAQGMSVEQAVIALTNKGLSHL